MSFLSSTLVFVTALSPDAGVQKRSVPVQKSEAALHRDGGTLGLDAVEAQDELEEFRALEATVVSPGPSAAFVAHSISSQLGAGSVAQDTLEATLESAELSGQELEFQLGQIANLNDFDINSVRNQYDIPIDMKPLVAQWIRFFTGTGRKFFRRYMSRASRYIPLMQPILEARGLPGDLVYLSMIESGFNSKALSGAAAVGLWQFIPGTAKMFKLKEDYWIDERQDPVKATHAAATFLGDLYRSLGHWYLAWAGYNAGPGRVVKMLRKYEERDFWLLSEKRGFANETIHYVPKLIACALVAKNTAAFGFTPDEFEPERPFDFEEVPLTQSVDLDVLAEAAQVDVAELNALNPELKRWCTPPADEAHPYLFRIPRVQKEVFAENFAKLSDEQKLNLTVHTVKKGDTLSRIAQVYRSVPEAIMRMNQLKNPKVLKLGSQLMVPIPRGKDVDIALARQVELARQAGFKPLKSSEEIPAGPAAERPKRLGGAVAVVPIAGQKQVSYRVEKGDSLWSIARHFDVHVADVREWNESLGASKSLKVGQTLKIYPGESGAQVAQSAPSGPASENRAIAPPEPATAKPLAVAPVAKVSPSLNESVSSATYTVTKGDSLWSIARQHNTSIDQLKTLNGLESAKLKLGQVLKVASQ
jgi:membrane-bound lytic murein transglycosylase D